MAKEEIFEIHKTTLRVPVDIWRATKIEAIKSHYGTANKLIVAMLLEKCGRLTNEESA